MRTREDVEDRYLVIYYTADRKSFQIVKPKLRPSNATDKSHFDGSWQKLAEHISGTSGYWGYEIR